MMIYTISIKEVGKTVFANFMKRMNQNYREELMDVVVMNNFEGSRAAAEFVVLGEYLHSDEGLPAAHGQHYRLLAGAFFEVRNGRIARVTSFYNLEDWIAQVS